MSDDAPGGTFIISLDCEGKWGLADRMDGSLDAHFTDAALLESYRRLLALFGDFQVRATFAFVAAFTLDAAERARFTDWFEDVEIGGANWLRHFRRQQSEGSQGWFLPETLRMVEDEGLHEIASHGFTHVPIGAPSVPADVARRELEHARAVGLERGRDLRTYVFPRNLVAHESVVCDVGFAAYRGSRTAQGNEGKLRVALKEWNILERADAPLPVADGALAIPAGHFLNWRVGLRSRVPVAVTLARWRHMIDDAARHGRVAHLWLHPHNLIDSGATFETLAGIVEYATEQRERGRLSILTQAAYFDRETAASIALR